MDEQPTAVNAPAIDIMRTVFPVTALVPGAAGELARPDSFGTAFSISPGVFLTAAHVVDQATAVGQICLAGPAGHGLPLGAARVTDYQVWRDVDVAILFADPRVTLLNVWLANRLQPLLDVGTFGYPHAFVHLPDDPKPRIEVVFRAYKGHIITTRGFERLPAKPAIYEVSCPFPPGTSGAPVLFTHDDHLVVVGLVLGCPKVHYQGMTQRVGAALIADEILPLRIEKTACHVGDLPGMSAVALLPRGAVHTPEQSG